MSIEEFASVEAILEAFGRRYPDATIAKAQDEEGHLAIRIDFPDNRENLLVPVRDVLASSRYIVEMPKNN